MNPSFAGLGVLVADGRLWYICRRKFRADGDYTCPEGTLTSIQACFEAGWVAEIIAGDVSGYVAHA